MGRLGLPAVLAAGALLVVAALAIGLLGSDPAQTTDRREGPSEEAPAPAGVQVSSGGEVVTGPAPSPPPRPAATPPAAGSPQEHRGEVSAPPVRDGAAAREAARIESLERSLRAIRGRDSANGTLWDIRGGWDTGRAGVERVQEALDLWWPMLGDGPHPWKGPVLLARANAKHALGDEARAIDLFIDALLAMNREGPQPPWGIPRLHFFAWGRNLAPYSEEDQERRSKHVTEDPTRSAGWSFIGGSPLLGAGTEGRDFGRWLVRVAKDDGAPDGALAATIWLHAVSLPSTGIVEGYETPPAAVALVLRWRPGGDLPERGSKDWWFGFSLAVKEAASREDPAALALGEEEKRLGDWFRSPAASGRQVNGAGARWTWSLRQEIATRFAAPTTERGKALRALAERLVSWE